MPQHRRTLIAALLVMATLAGSGVAGAEGFVLPGRPATVRESVDRLERARPALVGGSLHAAVSAAAELGGLRPDRLPAGAPIEVAGVPADLTAPVAALLSAGAAASAAATGAVTFDEATVTELAADVAALLDATTAERVDGAAGGLLRGRAALLQARIERGVDRPALAGAAAVQAAAVDAAWPALARAAARRPPRGRTVAGCDLVDQPPVLCVGGTDANTLTQNYALVIDLGGNDVHRHSAGGAAPTVNGLAVAVTLDLGGDDAYEATLSRQSEAAQGTGRTGGVGFLVDGAGDDSYRTVAVPTGDPAVTSDLINAQGAAVAGVGVLADLAGDDRYVLENRIGGSGGNGAQGLGTGVIGGFALALDRGAGNDVATVLGAPSAHLTEDGQARVSSTRAGAFGNAAGASVSVYADDGGRDVLTVRAEPVAAPDDGSVAPQPTGSVVQGFGYGGLGGAGVSLTGLQAQQMRAVGHVVSAAPAAVSSAVFGWVALGGLGAALDAGGGDHYEVSLQSTAERHDAAAVDPVHAESGTVSAAGMGHGVLGGVGIQRDLGGDDHYIATAVSAASASAARAAGAASLQVTASAGNAAARMQGFGATGAGLLEDLGGDDRYDIVAEARSQVTATDLGPFDTVVAGPGTAVSEGQAAAWGDFSGAVPGYGELRDVGGSDAYSSAAAVTTVTQGAADAEPGEGLAQAGVRQNGVAVFSDTDAGAADTFASSPASAACTGTRGQGVWVDCGTALGIGAAV